MLTRAEAELSLQTDTFTLIEEAYIIGPDQNDCVWHPPGFQLITCKSALVYSAGQGSQTELVPYDIELKKDKLRKKRMDLSGYNEGMIESRKDFKKLSAHIDLKVDWKTEIVTFYTTYRSYKHGQLDSDYVLMGTAISADGKTLFMGYLSTFHGVCQGIAQQAEWYSSETSTYALVIPATVEEITNASCYRGPDCSDIP